MTVHKADFNLPTYAQSKLNGGASLHALLKDGTLYAGVSSGLGGWAIIYDVAGNEVEQLWIDNEEGGFTFEPWKDYLALGGYTPLTRDQWEWV